MSDSHLHLFPHAGAARPGPQAPATGPYPLDLVERHVAAAAARGVAEVTFTEHFFRCEESVGVLGPFWEQSDDPTVGAYTRDSVTADRTLSLDRYVEVILAAKRAGLPVLLGLEVDYVPGRMDDVLEVLAPYPFDLLIGSVHWIGGWWFDRAAVADEWERRGHRAVYEEFFALSAAMVDHGGIDSVAHPDRLKYLGHRLPEEPVDLYGKLIDAATRQGTAIEVNAAGLRHPVGEIYPSPTLLEMAHAAGLDMTLGSDGHHAEQAGWGLGRAVQAAREAGYTHSARFVRRNRGIVPLPEGLAPD